MTTTIQTAPDKGEVTGQTLAGIAAQTGLPESEIRNLAEKAGIAALEAHLEVYEEITIPLSLVVVSSGCLPVFLNERTVRYVRECAEICNVDPDEWVEGWIGQAQVDDGLCGRNDVNFGGITYDMVNEHHDVGSPRSKEEKEELYEKLRGVAFRYQQELKQEAAASVEGGAE
ncbi:hypothetical protein OJ996_20465 [Luteolibacter sp. GHJ8]|uniref:Uncharacterized protein n=1 Tax=Luteolibacter rhizosphaerae TaxID=2989719 RepID=A0ABT3G7Z3_9BACT|nr:hypothetical protein [Luteolibacter rhizosphaerae]MCW1915973.1 hypothetical protein [Luteolibacter rhizosphaerae]